jgi:serine/threonine-protein kinase RsbW
MPRAVAAIQDVTSVRLELLSEAENVALVRATLAAVAEVLGFGAELLEDLNTAVSEACNNVVVHAYGEQTGPLVVHLMATEDAIEVSVRDRGSGIKHVSHSHDRLGFGLALISAVADRAEFMSMPDGGTEVRVAFTGRAITVAAQSSAGLAQSDEITLALAGDVVVTLSPVALLAGVLGRLARLLAARARFSLERFSDVYLVVDLIASHAQTHAGGRQIHLGVASESQRLRLTIGPLRAGAAAQLKVTQQDRSIDVPFDQLVEELTADRRNGFEVLSLVLQDRSDGSAVDAPPRRTGDWE